MKIVEGSKLYHCFICRKLRLNIDMLVAMKCARKYRTLFLNVTVSVCILHSHCNAELSVKEFFLIDFCYVQM